MAGGPARVQPIIQPPGIYFCDIRCGFEVLDTFGNQLREDEKDERLQKLVSSSQPSVDNKKSL